MREIIETLPYIKNAKEMVDYWRKHPEIFDFLDPYLKEEYRESMIEAMLDDDFDFDFDDYFGYTQLICSWRIIQKELSQKSYDAICENNVDNGETFAELKLLYEKNSRMLFESFYSFVSEIIHSILIWEKNIYGMMIIVS